MNAACPNQRPRPWRRLGSAALACLVALAPATFHAQRGRPFPPTDLGLLDSPDRELWQKPDLIMDELLIAEGSKVADLGAGGGWFTVRLARRVGPNGRVWAEDIQPQMLEAINRRVQREGLQGRVQTVLGTATDPELPPGLDAVLIVDAFHEMDDPADPRVILTLLKHVAAALKPQGRVGVGLWTPGAGGPGPEQEERVNPDSVVGTFEAAGLRLIAREPIPPFLYLLVFGKAASVKP